MKKVLIGFLSVLFIVEGALATDYNADNPNRTDGAWLYNWESPVYDPIRIDYFAPSSQLSIPDPGTSLFLVNGGGINGNVDCYNNGQFLVYGGYMTGTLQMYHQSSTEINGGHIGTNFWAYGVSAYDTSRIEMNGGIINGSLLLYDQSSADIYDGRIGVTHSSLGINAFNSSQLNIYGGFGYDSPGCLFKGFDDSSTIIYATFDNGYYGDFKNLPNAVWGYDENDIGRWQAYVSGTYKNGQHFALYCQVYGDAQLTLAPIPEPTTLSLLALGAFLAGRKRKV